MPKKTKRTKAANGVDLAAQLRATFEASGLSRFELARRAGLAYAVVHRFCGGERDVTMGTASKMANVLGVELRPVRK